MFSPKCFMWHFVAHLAYFCACFVFYELSQIFHKFSKNFIDVNNVFVKTDADKFRIKTFYVKVPITINPLHML